MKFTVSCTYKDFYEAHKVMYRSTKAFWIHLLFGVLILLMLFIAAIRNGIFEINNFLYLLLVIFFLFYPQTMLRLNSYFIYKKNSKLFSAPTQYKFDEGGVESTSEFASSKYNWNKFSKFVANDKILILYLSPQIALIIPKVIPDKDWGDLTKLIRRVLGAES